MRLKCALFALVVCCLCRVVKADSIIPPPGVTFSFTESLNIADLFLGGAAVNTPFTLNGNLGGKYWSVTFSLSAITGWSLPAYPNYKGIVSPSPFTFQWTAQHLVPTKYCEAGAGPVLSGSVGTGGVFMYESNPFIGDWYSVGNVFTDGSHGIGCPAVDDAQFLWAIVAAPNATLQAWSFHVVVADIPEPTSILLVASGLAGIGVAARRRRMC